MSRQLVYVEAPHSVFVTPAHPNADLMNNTSSWTLASVLRGHSWLCEPPEGVLLPEFKALNHQSAQTKRNPKASSGFIRLSLLAIEYSRLISSVALRGSFSKPLNWLKKRLIWGLSFRTRGGNLLSTFRNSNIHKRNFWIQSFWIVMGVRKALFSAANLIFKLFLPKFVTPNWQYEK